MEELATTDGNAVEVIDPGLPNGNAGPDFFNAKVKIGGTLWVGNVEIHDKASDWYAHGHDRDSHYDNVILHIARMADTDAVTSSGKLLPQMELGIPPGIEKRYKELLASDRYPPCRDIIAGLPRITLRSWMSALQTERMEQKTVAVMRRLEECNGSWEDAYFRTLARNYGFGINGDAFETWAGCVPLLSVAHHRDDIFQIEAVFMGQAGLLDMRAVPERHRKKAEDDEYFNRLRGEYRYLAHKFGLTPMDANLWRFLRLRPQNFPHIRISQLANLYYHRRTGLARLTECATAMEAEELMATQVTEYWKTHYSFGAESGKSEKRLSARSLRLIVINTAAPMLFAYGRYRSDTKLADRALNFLEQLPAEDNCIIRTWKECGMTVDNAGDSQALIQLKKEYCDKKDCLRCRIGYEYLKHIHAGSPGGLKTSTIETK